MKQERAAAIAAQKKTLRTFRVLDENICLLNYHADYGLPAMLSSGSSSILGMVRFLQRYLHTAGQLPLRSGGGCSTFNTIAPDGTVFMGRNFDYKEARCLVVWTHPKNAYRSVSMVNQNHLIHSDLARARRHLRVLGAPYASMDGVNEKGLCVAVLELRAKPTSQKTGKPPIVTTVAVRGMLDTCATVEEALAFLEKYDMNDLLGSCYHYQISDADGYSAIVEYVDGKMYVIRQKEKGEPLKVTNFFLTPNENAEIKGKDRFDIMDCALQKTPSMTEEQCMKLLGSAKACFRSRYKVFFVKTLWSAVYNLTERSMLLSAKADYSRQYRFYADQPGKVEIVKG